MTLPDGWMEATRPLFEAANVRRVADSMLVLAREDRLPHLTLDESRLEAAADLVIDTTRAAYPDLAIPYHARWRHFVAAGRDLWAELDRATDWPSTQARLRAALDLVIVSVLLDAGAGPDWRFREPVTGVVAGRSEGLGLASLAMFRAGLFSADPADPLRVDGERLARLDATDLATGFQVGADNPMVGLEGRAALLRRLGRLMLSGEPYAPRGPRLSRALDPLLDAPEKRVQAGAILRTLGLNFRRIWDDPEEGEGTDAARLPSCGDAWRHPLAPDLPGIGRAVPFQKLTQWLSYSCLEPLQAAGYAVTDLDQLTGLPEYRNGGLFLDTGVLRLKDPADAGRLHPVGAPLVVEWRALTVALLDGLADLVRDRLRLDATSLPLAKVLEGGTWAAGRRIAREKRADGGPPLRIASDGTVF